MGKNYGTRKRKETIEIMCSLDAKIKKKTELAI